MGFNGFDNGGFGILIIILILLLLFSGDDNFLSNR
jgi:hypothetical protein